MIFTKYFQESSKKDNFFVTKSHGFPGFRQKSKNHNLTKNMWSFETWWEELDMLSIQTKFIGDETYENVDNYDR